MVNLYGVDFAQLTSGQCIDHILGELGAGRGGWVVTPNLDILRRIVRDDGFRSLVSNATVRVADGMPLVWASRLQGTPLPERVAGSSMIGALSDALAEHGRSIYLLGGDPGAAQGAAAVLKARAAALKVAGTYCPPFGFESDEAEMNRIIESLDAADPDVVFVALGSPKQEHLIDRLRSIRPGTWWLGVGISFSFLSGEVRRAPRWLQKIGLEWVHRLVQEPSRLAKRYLLHGIPFGVCLMCHALRHRRRRRRPSK